MISRFDGTFAFLSNFYPSEFEVVGMGPHSGRWPTVEHYFQASKTFDVAEIESIRNATTPTQAKRLGRRVTLRSDWEDVKEIVMRYALALKFARYSPLARRLLATGDQYLEEGNVWGDRYWGVVNGQGQNRLGILLVARREELANEDMG